VWYAVIATENRPIQSYEGMSKNSSSLPHKIRKKEEKAWAVDHILVQVSRK
jgi:hypothetical protein